LGRYSTAQLSILKQHKLYHPSTSNRVTRVRFGLAIFVQKPKKTDLTAFFLHICQHRNTKEVPILCSLCKENSLAFHIASHTNEKPNHLIDHNAIKNLKQIVTLNITLPAISRKNATFVNLCNYESYFKRNVNRRL
jgi:hypothetical protein